MNKCPQIIVAQCAKVELEVLHEIHKLNYINFHVLNETSLTLFSIEQPVFMETPLTPSQDLN